MFNFNGMFDGMFKPVGKGCIKISMTGQPAIRVNNDYKVYNVKTGKLTNCADFAFDIDNAFWVIPTFKVEIGDIVLINRKPHCVIEVNTNSIKTFCYEDSTIHEVVPEHHIFMGKTYCYGKVFSPFMNITKSADGMQSMMTMMMLSQMFGNKANSTDTTGFDPMMFMFMGGGNNLFENMFEGAFNFGTETPTVETKE